MSGTSSLFQPHHQKTDWNKMKRLSWWPAIELITHAKLVHICVLYIYMYTLVWYSHFVQSCFLWHIAGAVQNMFLLSCCGVIRYYTRTLYYTHTLCTTCSYTRTHIYTISHCLGQLLHPGRKNCSKTCLYSALVVVVTKPQAGIPLPQPADGAFSISVRDKNIQYVRNGQNDILSRHHMWPKGIPSSGLIKALVKKLL